MTHTIVVAAGLCSAIRPKLLTALPPDRHPSVQITAWGLGHWHMPCPDNTPFPDADPWVKKHVAQIDVSGDLTYAKLIEYIVCRLIEMERKKQEEGKAASHMYLMNTPLEPRNIKWAAKWNSLPDPGEWVQVGCKHKPPKQDGKPQKQRTTQRTTRRTRQQQRGGLLGLLDKLGGKL